MSNRRFHAVALTAVLGMALGAADCARKADIEAVPIGAAVEVTREDGGVVRGTLKARDAETVKMAVGPVTRSIARKEIANVAVVDAAAAVAPALPPVAKFREYTVPEGTVLAVRMDTALGSNTSHVGDPVEAMLVTAESIDGVIVLPAGSILKGVVETADASDKVRGRATLSVRFQSIVLAGTNDSYALSAGMRHTSDATKGQDAAKIGIPAAGGAIIGAILGGKKGAVIGTVIGGGAGA
ncbi:MAG: hypothetical protein EPO35_04785, partial [Acidobacteria bacterium]